MTLRVLYALAGLVLAYGAVHGLILLNLVLDLGVLLMVVAAVLGWRRERSFIAVWPALLIACGFFAILGLQTWGFRECGATEQLRLVGEGGGAAGNTRSMDPCIVDAFGSKTQTVLASAGVAAALLLAVRDLRQTRRRLSSLKALAIPAGALALVGLYLASVALRSGESAHVDVTPWSIGVAFGAALAIAGGTVATWASGRPSLGAIFALAAGLLVLAPLSLFSIGILVFPVAVLVLVIAIRRLRRERSPRALPAAAAGVVIGIGALVYLLVLIQPASAECRAGGGGATSSGGLFGAVSYSSGGYDTATGESGGFIDEGDRVAYFTCSGGKMTDFHRLPLPQGGWVVTTQPSATVGRSIMIVFRVRPTSAQDTSPPIDGFDFTVTCRTCGQPQPTVRDHAILGQTHGPYPPGGSLAYSAQIVFPAAGSWWTSPYDAPIEVR